jgi:hypothetical protein
MAEGRGDHVDPDDPVDIRTVGEQPGDPLA